MRPRTMPRQTAQLHAVEIVGATRSPFSKGGASHACAATHLYIHLMKVSTQRSFDVRCSVLASESWHLLVGSLFYSGVVSDEKQNPIKGIRTF